MIRTNPFSRTLTLLSALAALHLCAPAQPSHRPLNEYSHFMWQTEDGLPENSVTSIIQTRDGFIWLGTLEGLVRFDGVKFTVYDRSTTPYIRSNRVLTLFEDSHGDIWGGTEGGGVFRKSGETWSAYSTANGLLNDFITSIGEGPDGSIWFATEKGLNRLLNGKIDTLVADEGIRGIGTRLVRFDTQGNRWTADDGGVTEFKGDSVIHYDSTNGLISNGIWALLVADDQSIWVGTVAGVSHIADGKINSYTVKDGLTSKFVWSLANGPGGSILVGTQGDGVNEIADGKITSFTTRDGLSNQFVWSVMTDRENNIWVGTNGGGLNRLREGLFTTTSSVEGLSNDFVWSVCEDKAHNIWVGTYTGLDELRDGKIVAKFTAKQGLTSDFIWSVYPSHDGTLWVGAGGGLFRYANNRFQPFTEKDGLPGLTIRSLFEDDRGTLWVGTPEGLAHRVGNRFVAYAKKDGLADNLVMAIAQGKDRTMWFGTGNGLSSFDGTSFHSYTSKDGLSATAVRSLHIDEDGIVWIGTQGGGLDVLWNGAIKVIGTANGLFDDMVSQILEDDAGNFWMSCNKGVFNVNRRELLAFVRGERPFIECAAFGKEDGMRSRECNGSSQPAGWKSADGRLWFPTIKGVVTADPRRVERAALAPPMTIEQIFVDRHEYSLAGDISAKPGKGEVEIRYAGLNFSAPEKLLFRYRLEGFDKDWEIVGNRRTAYFTNLPPGTYTFDVEGSNVENVWNPSGAQLSFTLLPHFYQTKSFFAFCVAIFAAFVFLSYRVRVHNLKTRAAELMQLVKERTSNLEDEKERAELARREAERQESLAREANNMKTELLNIAAHDLKSPLIAVEMFSHFIHDKISPSSEVAGYASEIVSSSRRMLDLINELLESAHIESGNIALQLYPVDLSYLAEIVVDTLRPQAERKGQHIEYAKTPHCIAVADEQRMRQVMENILSNAVKYSPRDKNIVVAVGRGNGAIRFSVHDEGPGLSADDMKRVFGKFQKLSARPTDGEPSTGLGLAIVKQLVHLQNGRVWVESEQGRGSVFIVELPERKTESAGLL